ncbi:MAG TPA: HAD family hydrolase [Candidatus Tumulicola sp.]|jgi:putative hydrolase of the HAD superfamily
MKRRIEAVLFDLDDTLHDDTSVYQDAAEEVAREIAVERGIDAVALKAAYVAEAEGFWHRLDPGDLKETMAGVRRRLWGSALGRLGIGDDALAVRSAQRYHDSRRKRYALFPETLAVLAAERDRGRKLGLVTNGFSETHREKLELLRLGDLFDAVFIADEVGMVKPDPLLFAHACRTLETSPAHSAMVGDRYDRDISGAIEAGLATVWLNLRGEPLPAGSRPPDAECSTIQDAGRILQAYP